MWPDNETERDFLNFSGVADTVAEIIVQARGAAAGFDGQALGGHSLKRGAMNTAKDRRVHPAQLKQLGRHRSYATLAAYIEEGDLFEDNALNGVL